MWTNKENKSKIEIVALQIYFHKSKYFEFARDISSQLMR